MRTKRSYIRITVTAIMTIVILVLFECFKVVYNNNNYNNEDLCVNVCRGSENSSKDFDSTEVRVHGELSVADFQLFIFHISVSQSCL